MPKVVKKVIKQVVKPISKITLELRVSTPVYDMGDFFIDGVRTGQLTLIRCEGAKRLVQVLKEAGIKVEIV